MVDDVDSSAFERRHVYGALDRFLTWCAKRGLIPANPCSGIDPTTGHGQAALAITRRRRHDQARMGRSRRRARSRSRVVSLLVAQSVEARGSTRLLWSEVDFGGKRITIRAERMKGRQPHSLPLSEPALAILADRMACRTAGDRVFAPPSGALTINWSFWMRHVRAALGEGDLERSRRFNLHDVRRSFVSALAERGFDVDLLDQLLGHSRKGVFGTYQRSSRWREEELAMGAWAELVSPSVAARDNVVSIRG